MAESQKGASTADSKKKGLSFDEDFGKDFLSSWKSGKKGMDALDFDVETAPLNKKKSFNFDKLDDFEIGGDFEKLSSFKMDMPKMDMPDLDFSSPLKKTDKPKDKSCKEFVQGKQESNQEKFSFNFDFNELDRFTLDSNLLVGEKKSSKSTDGNEPGGPIKNDKNKDSRSNSFTSIDVFEDRETKKLPTSECMVVSKSEHLIEPNIVHGAGPSTSSNYGDHDVPCEEMVSTDNRIVIVGENKNNTHSTEGHKQHSERICFTKLHSGKATQDFSLQSVSGDSSAQEALPQFGTGLASLNPVKANYAKELDDNMKSIDSSHSRNSSPQNSYNSRCWPGTSITESPNVSGESPKHQGNKNEATGGFEVLSESTVGQKDVENGSGTDITQKIAHKSKFTAEKQNSSPSLLPSSLLRGSILVKSMSVKEKATAAIQLKPLSKSADNVSQPTSVLTSKLLYSVDGGKIKTMHMCPADENRQSKQNDELKAEKEKDGILKSYNKGLTKDVSIITRSEKNDNNDSSRFQQHPSSLPSQITSSSTVKGAVPNLVSVSEPIKSFKKISTERQGFSVKDDKICDISSLKISGITKLNTNASNSTMHKETKSIRFSGRQIEFPPNTASKLASSGTTEKYSLSSPSLKRKTLEESKADPVTLNPLKRVLETTTERRKSLEVSPRFDQKMVPETENMEACRDNVSLDNLTSSRSITDFEVPILIENDGNVEKAEACAKELDDICNMLKKKREEAKELLVRAMVNNNTLLMLNHPMFDEKIRGLQKFATSLQSKQF